MFSPGGDPTGPDPLRSTRMRTLHVLIDHPLFVGVVVACVVALVVSHPTARADAIEGPPACPPGTVGRSAHEGRWCVPSPCVDDSGCRDGAVCRPWRVCAQTAMVTPGGLRPVEPPPEPRELAVASCAVEEGCDGTTEPPPPTVGSLGGSPSCTDGHYCIPPQLPPLPALASPAVEPTASPSAGPSALGGTPASCLCRTSRPRGSASCALLATLALALGTRASRRRP